MKSSSLHLITFALLCGGLQPFAVADNAQPPVKCVLFGIKGVLLYPDMKKVSGGGIGSLLGLTPEKCEKELMHALEPINVYNFPIFTHNYPAIIEAWLTNTMSNAQVHEIAHHYLKKHYHLVKLTRLKVGINTACSSEQAKILSTYPQSVSLAQRCKNNGCVIALCSSWNRETFESLKQIQSSVVGLFNEYYISGYCGKLAATPEFYDSVINKYGVENIVLVDCLQENIRAAKRRGIKTITFTSAAAAERELKTMGFLA
jgi:FMN phosphatase YigB (HAD superfamily)